VSILDDLISTLGDDSIVHEVYTCVFWTAVITRNCGLASTFREEHPDHGLVKGVGGLRGKSALELAQYAKSDNLLEASIGMATINSLIDIDEAECVSENALDILIDRGRDRNIAVIGHFPWVPKLQSIARKLWIIEQHPRLGDFPAEAAEEILPQADVIAITGTSLINHTLERLLDLSKDRFIVLVGPTSPLSPILFDYGIDIISGVKVIESEKVIHSISEGAIFRQVEGVRLLNMIKHR